MRVCGLVGCIDKGTFEHKLERGKGTDHINTVMKEKERPSQAQGVAAAQV